jgi:hypothetical protein
MLALTAIGVLAPLLYLPGYLITLAWLGPAQPPDALERTYQRVLAGALLNGWLALTLAELGWFSAPLQLGLVALVCAGCAIVAWRRGALRRPGAAPAIVAGPRAWAVRQRDALLFAGVLLLFAALVARPFEVVLGARDAGVYATTGFAIARTGAIVQHDALVQQIALDRASADPALSAAAAQAETNLLGVQPASRNIATRLRFAGYLIDEGDLARGQVTPQFFHLYPAWIALLTSLLGLRGGLLATSLLGLLGLWSVGMLGRRLAGGWVGLLGMLFLALNGAQVWFSRYSTSEATAQFCSFAALYGFAAFQAAGTGDHSRGARRSFAAVLAGVAAGQLALTRVDFFPIVVPLLLYLAYMALARRWSRALTAMALGLGAMLTQALLHILLISRAYFFDLIYARLQDQSALAAALAWPFLTPALRDQFMNIPRSAPLRAPYRLPLEIALVLLLAVAFAWLRRDGRPVRWVERQVLRYRGVLLRLGAALVLLLGTYGYLVRPQILGARTLAALPGCLVPGAAGPECLALQGYVGAPIAPAAHPNAVAYALEALPKLVRGQAVPARDAAEFVPGRAGDSEKAGIAQANLVRVGWYLSPLGMLLGLAGAALWWRRSLDRASWLFLVASIASTFFFVRLSYGTSDLTYIYIWRRFVPLAYPALSLCAAYALVALARQMPVPGGRRLGQYLAGALALAQLAFFVATNRQIYQHVEYAGALGQLAAVAGQLEPGAVLLLRGEGRDTPDLIATPLKYAYGVDTFAIRSPDPGRYAPQLAAYVRRWQAQGRPVYLALGANGAVELPGLRPVRLGPATLRLPEFQQLREQKPSVPLEFSFDFALYRLEPAGAATPPQPIAPDDFAAQVRGFYHPEQIDGARVAWTDGDALLRLAWPQDGAPLDLELKLAPGATRPSRLGPARACVAYQAAPSLALPTQPFVGEQCFELGPGIRSYRYTIDIRGQPAPADGRLLLRIAGAPWVPAEADPAQHDQRKLGVQFGGAR